MKWFRRRRPPVDDRWWEDGLPVRVKVLGPLNSFQRLLCRKVVAAEFEITRDFDKQLWGPDA